MDELVEDGDEIVCLRVVDKDSKLNSDTSLQEEKYKIEARKFLDHIQAKNDSPKSIGLISEFAVGRVPETIQRMVRNRSTLLECPKRWGHSLTRMVFSLL